MFTMNVRVFYIAEIVLSLWALPSYIDLIVIGKNDFSLHISSYFLALSFQLNYLSEDFTLPDATSFLQPYIATSESLQLTLKSFIINIPLYRFTNYTNSPRYKKYFNGKALRAHMVESLNQLTTPHIAKLLKLWHCRCWVGREREI